jgi:hypothetical protein
VTQVSFFDQRLRLPVAQEEIEESSPAREESEEITDESTRVQKLTERTNFELWKFKIRRCLGGKGLLKVLDKTYTIPTDLIKREELENQEQKTQGILGNALNEDHLAAVIAPQQRNVEDNSGITYQGCRMKRDWESNALMEATSSNGNSRY